MKKAYYIHFQGRISIGVSKKIDMQMEEFCKYFDMEELEIETVKRTFVQRLMGLFPSASIKRNYTRAINEINSPDFLYVRRTVADRAYVNFLKEIKERYPNCKIIIEIFTYPYDKDDFGKWDAWPFYFKELLYRGKLKNYTSRFVTYTRDTEIFGVPTICTTNGINIEKIKKVSGNYKSNQVTLVGVAYMQRHHGYERIIKGLYNYYKVIDNDYKVYLRLVGDGPEKKKYQKLVKDLKLEQYVKFYPTLTGSELDEIYNISDIALASFGMYKLGINNLGALKTRECLAKGMPMISGASIDGIDPDYQFVKIFPNNKTDINVSKIIEFFENIKLNGNKDMISSKIREYANANMSMEIVLKPIISYIES